MARAVRFQLVGGGRLQMDVGAAALAERPRHLLGRAGIDGFDARPLDAIRSSRVFQHDQGLSGVVGHERLPGELVPFEGGVRLSRHQEESVALVDLREMYRQRRFALLHRLPVRRHRGLHDVHRARANQRAGALPRGQNRVLRRHAVALQEAAGNGGNQRAIEHRVTGNHDA